MDLRSEILNSSKIAGLRQVLKALRSDAVRCVVLAEDADKHIQEKTVEAARVVGVQIHYFHSMEELGKLCGIQVSCAVVGLT